MTRGVVRRLAASRRMANVDRVAQIEMRDNGRDVGGVVVHVVTIADLARSPVATPVMGDDAIPLLQEEEHLGIPIVAAQRPAVMKHDGLRASWAPVLEVDRRSVFRCDTVHRTISFDSSIVLTIRVHHAAGADASLTSSARRGIARCR